ncbi:MAG: thiol-disulfide isomerase/thioredoxin [Planctomycetota bacterium]|jgi:thiol-disulfide isomerase/thioredoxin
MKSIPTSFFLLTLLVSACSTTSEPIASNTPVSSAPLTVVDRQGTSHDLDATLKAGRPVALIFWQSWCVSCLEEAPQLAKDSKNWGEKIQFLGVVPGPDKTVDESAIDMALNKFGLSYPQIRDRDLLLTRRFAVEGTPTIIVLGANNEVLYRGHQPPEDWGLWAK